MSGVTTARLKRGVSVPMDSDAIHPEAIIAAVEVGVLTLSERAEKEGIVLDWDTIELSLQHPGGDASTLVVRAAGAR